MLLNDCLSGLRQLLSTLLNRNCKCVDNLVNKVAIICVGFVPCPRGLNGEEMRQSFVVVFLEERIFFYFLKKKKSTATIKVLYEHLNKSTPKPNIELYTIQTSC